MLTMKDEKNTASESEAKTTPNANPTPKVKATKVETVEVELVRGGTFGSQNYGAGQVVALPVAQAENLIKAKLAKKSN